VEEKTIRKTDYHIRGEEIMAYTHIKHDKDMDENILAFVHSVVDAYALDGETFCLHVNNEEVEMIRK